MSHYLLLYKVYSFAVPMDAYLLPGNDHGFEVNWGGFGAQLVREKTKAFLQDTAD